MSMRSSSGPGPDLRTSSQLCSVLIHSPMHAICSDFVLVSVAVSCLSNSRFGPCIALKIGII
eukprot:m.167655 g.167655  ORF g.167655 m.167655 type:complete len:62 (-) comp53178_c0_seq4:75-260(-)